MVNYKKNGELALEFLCWMIWCFEISMHRCTISHLDTKHPPIKSKSLFPCISITTVIANRE